MKTQAEVVAGKILRDDVCLNCSNSKTGFKKKQPVLKCKHTDRIVPRNMIGCSYWKRKYG